MSLLAFSFWAGVLGVVAGTGMSVGFLGRGLVGREDEAREGSSSSGNPSGTEDVGGGVPFLGEGARGCDADETRLVGTKGWAEAVKRDLIGPEDEGGGEMSMAKRRGRSAGVGES